MAALCAPLRILLLWPGIIRLADFITPPASISPPPTNPASIETLDSQANTTQNQTSPSNSTETANATAATQAPPPPQCSYTVTPSSSGLQITINSPTDGNYRININEKGRPGMKYDFQRSNQTSSREIDHLKPCTDYEHHVTFIFSNVSEIVCNSSKTTTRTNPMSIGDITVDAASCIPGSVCYRSNWDISSSLWTNKNPAEKCESDNKTFCIKPDYNDICSNLTTNFTSGNCANSSFNIDTAIPVDFLDPSHIKQKPLNQLPAKINTEFPPNCVGLTVNYTCQEKGKPNESKKLSDLEPFTDYSCTGQVKKNNVTITNTTAVSVRIECVPKIIFVKPSATNTSIRLKWITTSPNCPDILQTLEKLSYDNCSCSPAANKWKPVKGKTDPAGGTCDVTGLETFTEYNCDVQTKYNNETADRVTNIKQKTGAGKPQDIHKVTLALPEHNTIKVSCDYKNRKFNGPEKKFIARLYEGSDFLKELKLTICDFEFGDLSYSTTYTVKVTAFNGELKSEPQTKHITTSYNDKALIGFLIFIIIIIIIIIVAMAVGIYVKCRKSRNVNEDMMLQTAIYVNVRPPGQHHKDAR